MCGGKFLEDGRSVKIGGIHGFRAAVSLDAGAEYKRPAGVGVVSLQADARS
jgi:hypothetical protein